MLAYSRKYIYCKIALKVQKDRKEQTIVLWHSISIIV